jgi:hypothetical protein
MERFTKKYIKNKKCSYEYAQKKYKKALHFGGLVDLIYKYTLGEKRQEVVPQVLSIVDGFYKGYGIGGIGGWTDFAWDNGSNEKNLKVPLSSIILWHPVRGEGIERGQAGPKTTQRAESVYQAIQQNQITYSRSQPLTLEQLNNIPNMVSDDTIKGCVVNYITNHKKNRQIKDILNRIHNYQINEDDTRQYQNNISNLENNLTETFYNDQHYTQLFLILSGQGRMQAIIEAVRKAGIQPDHFWITIRCKDIYLDICNVLLRIHNDWVEHGDFNDERHQLYIHGDYVPARKIPLAFSCAGSRRKADTKCYVRYNTNSNKKINMGCDDIYGYTDKIPVSRLLTSFGLKKIKK